MPRQPCTNQQQTSEGELIEGVRGRVRGMVMNGAYDKRCVWERIREEEMKGVIKVRRDARQGRDEGRDEVIRWIRERRYDNGWKEESGYGRRNIVEATFFRMKVNNYVLFKLPIHPIHYHIFRKFFDIMSFLCI